MTSRKVKNLLQRHLYQNGFIMSCTEFGIYEGWADVFNIQREGYTTEWEIKVDKKDFYSELKTIKATILNLNYTNGLNKINKHRLYILKGHVLEKELESVHYPGNIPNKFSFVLSNELIASMGSELQAVRGILAEAGYGLYSIHDPVPENCLTKIIQPKFIHKNKSINGMRRFAQRCFQENYNNSISRFEE